MRGQRRWAVVAVLVAGLCAAPSAVQALPASGDDLDAGTLLDRVQHSDAVGWSGYGESRGDLVLPDVSVLGDLPGLISGTARVRAWWRSPSEYRADELSAVGEKDVAVDGTDTWTWDSAARSVVLLHGDVGARLPRAADLLAPLLGARLSRTADTAVSRLPARRVARTDALGLRLVPRDPSVTTVAAVDLWAEPRTGLVLRVEVHAKDAQRIALTSELLDVSLSTPSASLTVFVPPTDAAVDVAQSSDIAAAADRLAPFVLPGTLAGLTAAPRVTGIGGVGTYGTGFTLLAVVPLQRDTAGSLLRDLTTSGPPGDEATFSTDLVQGLVARLRGRAYLLVGTVGPDVLRAALAQLSASPPPRRRSP